MKHLTILLFQFFLFLSCSQNFKNEDWLLFENEDIKFVTITETTNFDIGDFTFKAKWNNKLYFSDNIGYYGGIETLLIFENSKLITTVNSIEDVIALGEIYFEFYDYNFDGNIDFSYPISQGKSQWRKYYLYNKKENSFNNYKDWNYLKIQKINKNVKQILSQPDGTATSGEQTLYQIKENELVKIKTIKF